MSKNRSSDSRAHGSLEERREFVYEQYERLWDGVMEKARGLIEKGETDLSRLHLFMRRNFGEEFSDSHLAQKYRDHEQHKIKNGFIYDKQIIKVNDADSRVITLMTDAVKMREAIDAFGPNTSRILETGSGWGKGLFNLWLYGSPKEATYYALELTKSGRNISEYIAQHCASNLKLVTKAFEYYDPDFSFMDTDEKTCFFTHHSIEQIPEIGNNYIDRILETPGFHKCVHLEPVGWQIEKNDWMSGSELESEMLEIDAANKKFAEKRNQNRNLYPLLREYEKAGKIRIDVCRKYLCSHLINNATTLIVWSKNDNSVFQQDLSRRDDI